MNSLSIGATLKKMGPLLGLIVLSIFLSIAPMDSEFIVVFLLRPRP